MDYFNTFTAALRSDGRAPATAEKYLRDVRAFARQLDGRPVTRETNKSPK